MLAEGMLPPDRDAVIALTERRSKKTSLICSMNTRPLPELHKLMEAAKSARVVHFAERLNLHAQTEEEVLYPGAILSGEYLKLKTK